MGSIHLVPSSERKVEKGPTKRPININGKSCTGEHGCDPIYNGDTVYVEGYKDAFKATIYENDTPRYIPYL